MTVSELWNDLLSSEDVQRLSDARFGRRVGMGVRPAVIVIDAQRYMVGEPGLPPETYPSACPGAAEAVSKIGALVETARHCSVPVFYTRFALLPDGSDAGVYIRKREMLHTDGWCIEGTRGAEIVPTLKPRPGDVVLTKKKPSAFIGTPLLGMLIDLAIDTLVVTGGSTSNCVRATTVDAASYNFRALVPHDCVFDRVDISHRVALFDIDRQYGDVTTASAVAGELRNLVTD